MRGEDDKQEDILSYVSPEKARARGSSAASGSGDGGPDFEGHVAALCPLVL